MKDLIELVIRTHDFVKGKFAKDVPTWQLAHRHIRTPFKLTHDMECRINGILHGNSNDTTLTPKPNEFEMVRVDPMARMCKALFVYGRSFIIYGICENNYSQECQECANWLPKLFKGWDNIRIMTEIVTAMDKGDMDTFRALRTEIMKELDWFHLEINEAAMELRVFLGKVFDAQEPQQAEVEVEIELSDDVSPLLQRPLLQGPVLQHKGFAVGEIDLSRVSKEKLFEKKGRALRRITRLARALKRYNAIPARTTVVGDLQLPFFRSAHYDSPGQKALKKLDILHKDHTLGKEALNKLNFLQNDRYLGIAALNKLNRLHKERKLGNQSNFKDLYVEALEDLFLQLKGIANARKALFDHDA